MSTETTFENAKIGDRVWCMLCGWGKVESIGTEPYPIEVCFDSGRFELYAYNGRLIEKYNQSLFWDEIKFQVPPRPAKKEGWGRVYFHLANGLICFDKGDIAFHSKEQAQGWKPHENQMLIHWEEI